MCQIDVVLEKLSIAHGNLIIFCGAGISINSGLPTAIPLLDEILSHLDIDSIDKEKLIFPNQSIAMPFEVFFEIFLDNTNSHEVLDIFKEGEPSTNHLFIRKCYEKELVIEVYTTNFDLLIEKAFNQCEQKLLVFSDEKKLANPELSDKHCRLFKVHGSIDNVQSIRTTISTIARESLSNERAKPIDKLFGANDTNRKILFLGYSCSDVFDIIPLIEQIIDPKVEIYLIEHTHPIVDKQDVKIENIANKKNNNPFVNYRGQRIMVNTNAFIEWFWQIIDLDYQNVSDFNSRWKLHVEKWISGFESTHLKYTIIGQLFYRISNYDLGSKYHKLALECDNDKNSQGAGAAYTNLGLIYHDLKKYKDAIEHFEIADSIFEKLEFHYGRAAVNNNLGHAYTYLLDKEKAVFHLEKSLQISRDHEFREKNICESDALNNYGVFYEKYSDYDEAINYYQQTLTLDRENGNKSGEAQTLSDLGRVNLLIGQNDESLAFFLMSQNLAEKLGMQTLLNYTSEQIKNIKSSIG